MAPLLPVLVKSIATLAHCGAVDVKLAVGVWRILIVVLVVTEQPELISLVVKVTVLVPGVE